jgi:hypothetical protein
METIGTVRTFEPVKIEFATGVKFVRQIIGKGKFFLKTK